MCFAHIYPAGAHLATSEQAILDLKVAHVLDKLEAMKNDKEGFLKYTA